MNDASQRVDANAVETVQRRQQTEVYISRLSAVIRLCADVFPEGKVEPALLFCAGKQTAAIRTAAVNIVFIIFIFIITLFFSLGSQSIPLILHFLYPFAS